ncbi:hypothetical protein QCD61_28215 (plasmid) [Pseudomonas viciae]|uniref:Uncharacterized protein n=1 Tax=Pseudomonas viciae TaxID=2505979 RepID=A0ABY8PMM0_9PSED|nr:hypothetical protein [Pseudomonas viciae]WGO96450.1 hypothetical protein QCD61_28215 [Pseudomonas viciae]
MATTKTKGFFREYHVWGLLLGAFALAAWIVTNKQDSSPTFKTDPVSGSLDLYAKDCLITGPGGQSIKEDLLVQLQTRGKMMIPQGSLVTGDCFPTAKAAISAELKQGGN